MKPELMTPFYNTYGTICICYKVYREEYYIITERLKLYKVTFEAFKEYDILESKNSINIFLESTKDFMGDEDIRIKAILKQIKKAAYAKPFKFFKFYY